VKHVVIDLRLHLEVDDDVDKDEAAERFFRSCRGQRADFLLHQLRVVDIEVDNQYGFAPAFEEERYRGLTDGDEG